MFFAPLLSFWIHYGFLACYLASLNVVNVQPLKAHSVCASNFNVRGYKIVRKKDDHGNASFKKSINCNKTNLYGFKKN